jgi:hypothetical protein
VVIVENKDDRKHKDIRTKEIISCRCFNGSVIMWVPVNTAWGIGGLWMETAGRHGE